MTTMGEFYKLIRHCGCGSGLLSEWCKDEKQVDVKACDRCKPELLARIFEDKYLDLFQNWVDNLLAETNPGWEWVWQDLLKEKGCEQVTGRERAMHKCTGDQVMIPCPHGDNIYSDEQDRTVHILVPKEYAELVLKTGRMG